MFYQTLITILLYGCLQVLSPLLKLKTYRKGHLDSCLTITQVPTKEYWKNSVNFSWTFKENIKPTNILTSDQRCFNVVGQRWNKVDPTLKMKRSVRDVETTSKQRQDNITQRRNNVAQRWYNVDAILFQPSVDVS